MKAEGGGDELVKGTRSARTDIQLCVAITLLILNVAVCVNGIVTQYLCIIS